MTQGNPLELPQLHDLGMELVHSPGFDASIYGDGVLRVKDANITRPVKLDYYLERLCLASGKEYKAPDPDQRDALLFSIGTASMLLVYYQETFSVSAEGVAGPNG